MDEERKKIRDISYDHFITCMSSAIIQEGVTGTC